MNIPSVNQPYPGATTGKTTAAAAARTVARSQDATPAESAAETSATAAVSSSQESLTLDQTASLARAMNSCPDTRTDVVARGKALAADPNYPPSAVVSKLSRLFVADASHSKSDEA